MVPHFVRLSMAASSQQSALIETPGPTRFLWLEASVVVFTGQYQAFSNAKDATIFIFLF